MLYLFHSSGDISNTRSNNLQITHNKFILNRKTRSKQTYSLLNLFHLLILKHTAYPGQTNQAFAV